RAEHAAVDVLGQCKAPREPLLDTVFVGPVAHVVAAAASLDARLERLGEGRSALHDAIALEAEHTALRKDHGLVVQRAIAEPEDKAAFDSIVSGNLCDLACGYLFAVDGPQNREAMREAFSETNGDGCRSRG